MNSGESAEVVRLQRLAGHVALVTLCRREAANSISPEVARRLEDALLATEADEDVWVVILTAEGDKCFCAGADLKEIAAGRADGLKTARGGFAGLVRANRSKPWIVAVNGAALGGGCEIALACDLIVAAEHARFGLPEVRRGLIAGAGGLFRLPRAIPPIVALELIMTARTLGAVEAHRWGLVNRVVPRERLLDEAIALAHEITRNSPSAVRESLRVARQANVLDDAQLWPLNDECRAAARASEDYAEGALAFLEKREPRWTGAER